MVRCQRCGVRGVVSEERQNTKSLDNSKVVSFFYQTPHKKSHLVKNRTPSSPFLFRFGSRSTGAPDSSMCLGRTLLESDVVVHSGRHSRRTTRIWSSGPILSSTGERRPHVSGTPYTRSPDRFATLSLPPVTGSRNGGGHRVLTGLRTES